MKTEKIEFDQNRLMQESITCKFFNQKSILQFSSKNVKLINLK